MQLPSLENLRCFDAAAHLLSFRAAARVVGLTPAALGQRIRQLEEQLGAPLFRRTTRSVALTEAGLALVPRAQAALAAAAECGRAARGEAALPPIEITLGTRWELGLSFIVPELPNLLAARPGLSLNLYFGAGRDLLHRIRSRELDCAVTSAHLVDSGLDAIRLHEEQYALVGLPRLLARTPLRRATDAVHHTLLDIDADLPLFRYLRDAPGGEALRFARLWRVGSGAAIHALVLRGAGVAVLPLYMVQRDLARGRLRRLLPAVRPLHDHFRLVFRGDDPRRAVYEAVAGALLAAKLR
jgi:LysR family transcriptional regulator, glycine cleavage system transcriptional activator